jgi:hypothetical protein
MKSCSVFWSRWSWQRALLPWSSGIRVRQRQFYQTTLAPATSYLAVQIGWSECGNRAMARGRHIKRSASHADSLGKPYQPHAQ